VRPPTLPVTIGIGDFVVGLVTNVNV